MLKIALVALLAALSASLVSAHYQLTYPAARGFVEDQEPTAPCGGFNSLQNRTEFPISGGFLEIYSEHVKATFQINLVFSSNPQDSDFTAADNSSVENTNVNNPGNICFPLSLSGIAQAKNGTNATIQTIYNAGDGTLYQCADVVLVTNATGWNSSACINSTASSVDGDSNSSTATTSATASGKAGSGAAEILQRSGLAVLLAVVVGASVIML
ncbi:hypothetical protein BC937DRAFT_91606 [Endogone sp. FLAS-F59071]|nr:hypothetical protein BC937DRAFT_91606 [Endogone sp. FLAS-F59071]|eukprot:RUS16109.1 hypothetical protein BC937DRAFT_91606 [Endogone sp. FLAS-F59071]